MNSVDFSLVDEVVDVPSTDVVSPSCDICGPTEIEELVKAIFDVEIDVPAKGEVNEIIEINFDVFVFILFRFELTSVKVGELEKGILVVATLFF